MQKIPFYRYQDYIEKEVKKILQDIEYKKHRLRQQRKDKKQQDEIEKKLKALKDEIRDLKNTHEGKKMPSKVR